MAGEGSGMTYVADSTRAAENHMLAFDPSLLAILTYFTPMSALIAQLTPALSQRCPSRSMITRSGAQPPTLRSFRLESFDNSQSHRCPCTDERLKNKWSVLFNSH